MAHPFLSEDWFTAIEALRADAPAPPVEASELNVNLVVTGAPTGDVSAHLHRGQVERGLVEAPTLIKVPYEVAKDLLVTGEPGVALRAVLEGTITIEGDPTAFMVLQSSLGDPSAEQLAFQRKVQALTS